MSDKPKSGWLPTTEAEILDRASKRKAFKQPIIEDAPSWPAWAGPKELYEVLDAWDRVIQSDSAAHAGEGRRGYRSPVSECIQAICKDLAENALDYSPSVILVLLRADSFDEADVDRIQFKTRDLSTGFHRFLELFRDPDANKPNTSLVKELFDAGVINLRVKEVVDSVDDEDKTAIHYQLRNGTEGTFSYKTIRNIVSSSRGRRNSTT